MAKTVFVGMSGGVDSSVTAALLKERGFNVVGIHLRCWNVDGCAETDAEDARRASEVLNIPFYVFDFEKEYKQRVVEYMVSGYKSGITPNPDVMCNQEIKFGLFYERAMAMGADYIATGHYVKLVRKSGGYVLVQAKDKTKDQSYFLWTLKQSQLKHCLFPLGDLIKRTQVRALAKKYKLPNAEKKDSQGVCFLGEVMLPDFLSQFIPSKRGKVITVAGKVVGEHKGAAFYTIGQRRGVGVSGSSQTLYVAEKDIKKNLLTVAPQHDPSLFKRKVSLTNVNLMSRLANNRLTVFVRVRYRQPLFPAILEKKGKSYILTFKKSQEFVATGQSAVMYTKGGVMQGGGIIKSTK